MDRRRLFPWLAGLPFFSAVFARADEPAKPARKLNIMMKSAWGSDDPTRAAFVFLHGLALADAGHDVQIFLTGEATYLMRKATVDTIQPIGWPPLSETREKILAKHIPVFA
jgi:predicted peroxiredoxin